MSFSSLSSAQLHKILSLIKEKEALQAKIAKVERELDELQSGKPSRKASSAQEPNAPKRRRRKAMKGAILKQLQKVGSAGISVADLAANIRARPASVAVWFYTTGKTTKGIKKVGRGRYAYIGG